MIKTNPFDNIAVLIPAYDPDEKLLGLVGELLDAGCSNVIVVDDGSKPACREIFSKLRESVFVTVCGHTTNRGKGAALKTGFGLVQTDLSALQGVITADADGQHLSADICRLAAEARRRPLTMVLGCRTFGNETPFRSMFGNRLTAFFMSFVHGIKISDTQTGLRYVPTQVLPELAGLPGDGYEFELQCLITAKELGCDLIEVPISTVYIDGNASSHFLPVADSIRIYSVLFRFGGSSIMCFGIDIALFTLVYWSSDNAMLATIVARVISGAVNFSINKILVFRRRRTGRAKREALAYFVLWLVLMVVSGLIVSLVAGRPTALVVSTKILVDISLFLLSYHVQSRYVFSASRNN